MKLCVLQFISFMRMLNGLDHKFGACKIVEKLKKKSIKIGFDHEVGAQKIESGIGLFLPFSHIFKVCEDLKYETSHLEVYHFHENIKWITN